METPIPLDLEPMLAAVEAGVPEGENWEYEPKWDGFRILAHRSGDSVAMISRGARSMTRYFPEMVPGFQALRERKLVLDGELIVVGADGLDFDALQQRIHPADSRVQMLSRQTPAWYVAFDLLAIGDQDLRALPLGERRSRLEAALDGAEPPVHLTPYTRHAAEARRWFELFEGAGLDGIIAKRWDQAYLPGKRGWVKVKHERTADCVVIGFRWSSDHTSLGSLLLGLHDDHGKLHYVGHTSSFSAAERRALLEKLEPMRTQESTAMHAEGMGRAPGGPSRWSRGRDTDWESVRPELVCEIRYEKLQSGERFRHAARFLRWRLDKTPAQCGFDQVESAAGFDILDIFGPSAPAGGR